MLRRILRNKGLLKRHFGLIKINMPAVSPTMTEGKILEYSFQEGQLVEVGESLAQIETDKATVGLEIQDEGYLARIVTGASDQKVQVGELIAYMVEEENELGMLEELIRQEGGSPQSTHFMIL